ncbi:type II toxin-antitoxin system Phd/YefM family antitoxin [Duganella violaceipulchra]|uniref:Antitoxin (DNA-binding transcriptional repressor) of toxin-antitoxin stability system n=1 Tax=Duganella violaceipulchra TaxID=2849652 RepID=A0AA41HB50_9BURK|nr:hypothetical protein [Duganella violaceicalia]MBV6321379.1 hypothetical protein [Duganella violaceicalia]MCP2009372.1 antitoxin (DNA-binding transcriptional repressor) of toxin-antitoxin stability system [Duganella violaceicalia]
MKEFDINDVRTNLFLSVDNAVRGEPFLITQSGRALVKVEAVPPEIFEPYLHLAFMVGQFTIPDDFDALDP